MHPINLITPLPPAKSEEHLQTLLQRPGCRIQRIASHGHVSGPDFWYDQDEDEWLVLLEGEATLRLDDPTETIPLVRGDSLFIPAHRRHRVTRTSLPTVWLAVWLPAKS